MISVIIFPAFFPCSHSQTKKIQHLDWKAMKNLGENINRIMYRNLVFFDIRKVSDRNRIGARTFWACHHTSCLYFQSAFFGAQHFTLNGTFAVSPVNWIQLTLLFGQWEKLQWKIFSIEKYWIPAASNFQRLKNSISKYIYFVRMSNDTMLNWSSFAPECSHSSSDNISLPALADRIENKRAKIVHPNNGRIIWARNRI